MATNEQKKKLIDVLKFTPTLCTVSISGLGGEVVMGTISAECYDFFNKHGLEVGAFATDREYLSKVKNERNLEVNSSFWPFNPGEWFTCDDLIHECGPEMDVTALIEITDSEKNIIWSSSLDLETLKNQGVKVVCLDNVYASDHISDPYLFYGKTVEKGTLFVGELDLKQSFNPSKLTIYYTEIESWPVFSYMEYNDVEVDEDGPLQACVKDWHYSFINIGPEGVLSTYDAPASDEVSYDIEIQD